MSQIKKLSIVLFFLIFSLGVVSWLVYQKTNSNSTQKSNQSKTTENKNYPNDLKGKVYLTMRELTTGRYGIYTYDFATKSLNEEKIVNNCLILGGEINYAGTEMTISDNCNEKNESHIYIANANKESKQITKSSSLWKKEVVWSDDGTKLAFMAIPTETKDVKMEDWQIVTSDLEGNEKVITNAVHPFFSPDGKKILALKKAGLFLFDTETQTEKNIHTFKSEAPISLQLDLSRKKDLLVIANPIDRDITIYRIKDWNDFQMEEIMKIETKNTYVSWPKLDPNSDKYIITEEIDDNGKIELIAYNLEAKERHFIEDLSFYRHDSLWINDWR